MAKKSKGKPDPKLYVITAQAVATGEAVKMPVGKRSELHALGYAAMAPEGLVAAKMSEVAGQWAETLGGVATMLSDAARKMGDTFQVAEIKVDLAVDAKGKLAFIAEASAKASVSVTLKRSAPVETKS